ncbi:ATP-grasp domain-containing protein [Denitromonas iodatirespirans]|uniref:ATP-grasp domain-containing protein n=1 Tax=Denitromonas iodatirespirans TaxID=2795389 RepID=A0A944DG56_DENI1|nr:hypothetical protein [Denitromonas iodatirespirans]MBT0963733.1 hypothetical protein [Denitromonas iodatirespirans]
MPCAIDVTILTDDRYVRPDPADWYQQQIATEDGLVADALSARGLTVARRSWSDPAVDWRDTRCALFRSTWDYFDRFAEFSAWFECVSDQTRLFNDAATLRWNMDKRYLAELARAGVASVPTVYAERGSRATLAGLLAEQGWTEAVFKPVVSGAARLTYRIDTTTAAAHEARFAECVAAEAMMVQAFEPAIVTSGELSLIVIDGRTTHAIRKTAKAGDFRVQDDHGGTVHAHTPAADERAFAEAAVRACPTLPLYARVDFVRRGPGDFRLMELELVEPELFFRFAPAAADTLADALVRRLAG